MVVRVFVKTLTGRVFSLEMSLDDSILVVKQKICLKTSIPPKNQHLRYGTKQLWDKWTVKDCGIQTDGTIQMVVRVPG